MDKCKRRDFLRLGAALPAGMAISSQQFEFDKLLAFSGQHLSSTGNTQLENKNTLVLSNYGGLDILIGNLICHEFDLVNLRNYFDARPGKSAVYSFKNNVLRVNDSSTNSLLTPSRSQRLKHLEQAVLADNGDRFLVRAMPSEISNEEIKYLKEQLGFQIIAHSLADTNVQIQTYLNREKSKQWACPLTDSADSAKEVSISEVPLRWLKDFVGEQRHLILKAESHSLFELVLKPSDSIQNAKAIASRLGLKKPIATDHMWTNTVFEIKS